MRYAIPVPLLLFACQDAGLQTSNARPTATIVTPSAASEFLEGTTQTLIGTVGDADHRPAELRVTWWVDDAIVCEPSAPDANGETRCETVIPGDARVVRLEVRDPSNQSAVDETPINLVPDADPIATLLRPADGSAFPVAAPVFLEGQVQDVEDAAETLQIRWLSDRDGVLGTEPATADGYVTTRATLSAGSHLLALEVTDSLGHVDRASVEVEVRPTDAPPSCAIQDPVSDIVLVIGDELTLVGQGSDAETTPGNLLATWTSDIQGVLTSAPVAQDGQTQAVVADLAPGMHQITLLITDDIGQTCSDARWVTVDARPTVSILAPVSGAILPEGVSATLDAMVSDVEDDPADLTVEVRSDIQGVLDASPVATQGLVTASLTPLTHGPHILTVDVTDSSGSSASTSVAVTIDGVPSAPRVAITPSTPDTTTDLATLVLADSVDPDGDPVTYAYAWTRNGQATGHASERVDAADTQRGDVWTVVVTPSDPWLMGDVATDTVIIGNALPVADDVTILPPIPTTHDDLSCQPGTLFDLDADAVTWTATWFVDGAWFSSGTHLPAGSVPRGTSVTCEISPHDGLDAGAPVSSSEVIILNGEPAASGAVIQPDPPRAGDTVHCTAVDFTDPDGDADQSLRRWYVDDALVGEGPVLPVEVTADQVVRCELLPFDGLELGDPVMVEAVIANTPPSATSARITPDPAQAGTPLSCAIVGFQDVDGDTDASIYAWTIDGQPAGSGPTLGAVTRRGQQVRCTATPSDGRDDGLPVIAELVISNTLPSVADARITPPLPTIEDELRCEALGASDADGDPILLDITWYADGVIVGYGPTLPAGTVLRDAEVTCDITPSDGPEPGATVTSAPVFVQNSTPAHTGITISPAPPRAGDILQCMGDGFIDADGDADQSTFAWTIDGQPVGATAVLNAPIVRGQLVGCYLTPFDGRDAGPALFTSEVVVNTPPTATQLGLTVPVPGSGDPFQCDVLDYQDIDGDDDGTTFTWSINGQAVSSGPTMSLPTSRDDVVTCTAQVFDGWDDGPVLTATTTVSNAPPQLSAVSILPFIPTSSDDLLCISSPATDADGDATSVSMAWEIDGITTHSGPTLAAGIAPRGATVRCLATPRDPFVDGPTLASNPVVIGNSVPSLASVSITPQPPRTADEIRCVRQGYADVDGDPDQTWFAWTIDGQDAGSGDVLSQVPVKGQVVGCTATPHDGREDGSPVSNTAIVVNTPPSATQVLITPSNPVRHSTLSCGLADYTDDDGDPDQSTLSWAIDGVTVSTDPVLPGPFVRGQRVTCTVSLHDGEDAGPTLVGQVTIGNSPPLVDDAAITPLPLYTETDALATASLTDLDGDPAFARFTWLVDGIETTEVSSTLDHTAFVKGQEVVVMVTPDDGADQGTPFVVGPHIVANSPPRGLAVEILPADPAPYTELTCVITNEAFDPDGDDITYRVAWVPPAGAPTASTTSWPGDTITADQVIQGGWTCRMTPTDVEGLDGQTASATLDVVGLWPDQLVPLSGADVQIYGEDLSDHVGDGTCPLATPDIDGDGIPDLVIGINELNLAVGNDAGGVRIFFGAGLARGETMPISWADVAIDGDQRNGRLGQCVASAGDLDGDGRDELLVGQPRFNGAGLQAGRVLLYRGSDLTLGAQLETTDAWRTWTGVTPRDWAGLALDGGKDVDGGGVPDLLIGAPQSVLTGVGHAYLLRGEALPDSGSLGPAAHWTFVAPDVADQSAYQVALGDVSGDGRADIVVSAPKDDTTALLAGAVHLFDAAELPAGGGTVSLSDARWHMTGIEPDDQLGMRLALSDMDDDGRVDLLVGSHYADISDTDDGLALVQLAADLPASGDIYPLAASRQVWGSAAGDRTGRSLYAVPDMDNDGRPELLVGAPDRDFPEATTGDAGLFTSRRAVVAPTLLFGEADHLFRGEDGFDHAGQSVHGADLDGDGRGDVIVGAPYEDGFWPSAGSIYIYFAP